MKYQKPLKDFFFKDTLCGLSEPLFKSQVAFVEYARSLGYTVWGSKPRGEYPKVLLNKQLNLKSDIKDYYHDFRIILCKRIKQINIEQQISMMIISNFEYSFEAHGLLHKHSS